MKLYTLLFSLFVKLITKNNISFLSSTFKLLTQRSVYTYIYNVCVYVWREKDTQKGTWYIFI